MSIYGIYGNESCQKVEDCHPITTADWKAYVQAFNDSMSWFTIKPEDDIFFKFYLKSCPPRRVTTRCHINAFQD